MLAPKQVLRLGTRRLGISISTSSVTAQYSADLQARLQTQISTYQQTLADKTGINTTNARVSQGAQSAVALVQGGYNPSSASDNANLVHAIAGGCALIPGAGPLLAGAVETLWLVGNQIACPVTDAFASVGLGTACNAPPCSTTGAPWTAAGLLASNAQGLPAMPTGSFASLAVPALATYAAAAGNCKGGMPPDVIVDAVVAIWNQTHAGPAVGYFIPPIATLGSFGSSGSGSITPDLLVVGAGGGSTPAGRAGKDPNAYYGFGPVSTIISDGYYESNPPANVNQAQDWTPFYVAPAPPGMSATTPRIVMVNSGAVVAPAKSATSVVVESSASLLAGGLAGGLLFAWISGQAANVVFDSTWAHLVGLFRSAPPRVPALTFRETRRKGRR